MDANAAERSYGSLRRILAPPEVCHNNDNLSLNPPSERSRKIPLQGARFLARRHGRLVMIFVMFFLLKDLQLSLRSRLKITKRRLELKTHEKVAAPVQAAVRLCV